MDEQGRERRGFKQTRYEVQIKTEAPEEKVRKLHNLIEEKCPITDVINYGIEAKGEFKLI